jgi:YVTN family beta-propeller protein
MLIRPMVFAMMAMVFPVFPASAASAASADGVLATIHVDNPSALAVNPTTNEIYVASSSDNSLTLIDGATDTITRTISIGVDPRAVAVDPATDKIYVACYGSGAISVFDEDNGSIASLNVGTDPLAVAVDQNADKIYVVNDGSSDVTVIDGATNGISTIKPALTFPRDVAVNDATGMIYAVAGASVYKIDPKTGATTMIASGTLPKAIAVDQSTGVVYADDMDNNDVMAIFNAGPSAINVGTQPVGVAVNQATGWIYTVNGGSDDLTAVDQASGHPDSVSLGAKPVALAVNPDTGEVYALSQDSNSLIVVGAGTAASSSGSGASTPALPSTTAPAQQTVISLNIGKTAYSVNGTAKAMDAAPVLYEGRTLLPISYVAVALGASVDWNQAQQEATLSLNGKTLELWIGKSAAMVNGISTPIDPDNPDIVPTLAPPGRVMLPLRFFCENLGCQVDWNPSLQEITVAYPKP